MYQKTEDGFAGKAAYSNFTSEHDVDADGEVSRDLVPTQMREALPIEMDKMTALLEQFMPIHTMITTEDRSCLLDDDPTEVYGDGKGSIWFTFHGLLNCFNMRKEHERLAKEWCPNAPEDPRFSDDEGLLISDAMLREILQVRFGIGQHILKVDGKATRLWRTSRDRWPVSGGGIHHTKEYLEGSCDNGPPEWRRIDASVYKLPEEQRAKFKAEEEKGTLRLMHERKQRLWELEDEAGKPRSALKRDETIAEIKHRILTS